MKNETFLLDTHALVYWVSKDFVSAQFIEFLDKQSRYGNLFVSSISFWEMALLCKKKRLFIEDLKSWVFDVIRFSNIHLIDPSYEQMIASVHLPDFHKDPFDRLLISQAINSRHTFVTKDKEICKYELKTFWM